MKAIYFKALSLTISMLSQYSKPQVFDHEEIVQTESWKLRVT